MLLSHLVEAKGGKEPETERLRTLRRDAVRRLLDDGLTTAQVAERLGGISLSRVRQIRDKRNEGNRRAQVRRATVRALTPDPEERDPAALTEAPGGLSGMPDNPGRRGPVALRAAR